VTLCVYILFLFGLFNNHFLKQFILRVGRRGELDLESTKKNKKEVTNPKKELRQKRKKSRG
jgi:hypothetical protein